MIKFADDNTKPLVRQMWKICFEDTEEFMDLHFSHKYKNENTLLFFVDEVPVASLQMFEYSIRFYGKRIPFYYLAGLCTLPEYRQRGFMAQLIDESHRIMKERNVPLSILIPAEDWLYGFYEKYGYEKVFEGDENVLPIKDIIEEAPDLRSAYEVFDRQIQSGDFCILKTYDDFLTLIEERKQEDFSPKYNLSGMARIIDAHPLLYLYSQSLDEDVEFTLKVVDGNVETVYQLSADNAIVCPAGTEADLTTDIRKLCRLLFGFKTSELAGGLDQAFPEHKPIMNLMLE